MTLLRRYRVHLSTENGRPSAEHVYGLILHLLGPALDREGGASKPISVSPGDPADHTAHFQVGALTGAWVSALESLTASRDRLVPLGSGTAILHSVEPIDPRPVAYQALFDQAAPPRQMWIRFLTPTCILQDRQPVLFPDPPALFGAMLSRFNAYSPFRFPPDVLDHLGRLRILRYRLSTCTVHYPTHRLTGFTGWICYGLPPDLPPPLAYLAAALVRFAQYSGVGSRTHLGLGQVDPAGREVSV